MAPNHRLKQARELRGWSQAKVAEQIETDATTVSRWERGLFLPTPHFRERLCTLFASNAEELGLLESTRSSLPHVTLEALEKASSNKNERSAQIETPELGDVSPSQLPFPDNVDTFTYILQSASQEQQAYMLWEHAYVRALQDQRDDAQHLGEASAQVFEQASHPNATRVRTWLKQQGLAASSPTSPHNPSKPGRKKSSWFGLGGAGLFLLSLIVVSLLISRQVFRWSPSSPYPNSSLYSSQSLKESKASPVPTHAARAILFPSLPPQPTPSPSPALNKGNTYQVSTPTPQVIPSPTVPTSIPSPSASGTPLANGGVTASTDPSQLTPHTCNQEGTGYRCTLTLNLYATTTTTYNWEVLSTALPARFNPASGTIVSGQTARMIIYIDTSSCAQTGMFIFKFNLPSSTSAISLSRIWQC